MITGLVVGYGAGAGSVILAQVAGRAHRRRRYRAKAREVNRPLMDPRNNRRRRPR